VGGRSFFSYSRYAQFIFGLGSRLAIDNHERLLHFCTTDHCCVHLRRRIVQGLGRKVWKVRWSFKFSPNRACIGYHGRCSEVQRSSDLIALGTVISSRDHTVSCLHGGGLCIAMSMMTRQRAEYL